MGAREASPHGTTARGEARMSQENTARAGRQAAYERLVVAQHEEPERQLHELRLGLVEVERFAAVSVDPGATHGRVATWATEADALCALRKDLAGGSSRV